MVALILVARRLVEDRGIVLGTVIRLVDAESEVCESRHLIDGAEGHPDALAPDAPGEIFREDPVVALGGGAHAPGGIVPVEDEMKRCLAGKFRSVGGQTEIKFRVQATTRRIPQPVYQRFPHVAHPRRRRKGRRPSLKNEPRISLVSRGFPDGAAGMAVPMPAAWILAAGNESLPINKKTSNNRVRGMFLGKWSTT